MNREGLPEEFSRAFAQIIAARVRLRGDNLDQGELANTLRFARRLASTNEALVATRPDREDRTAAAFVSATAHQLVYQVEAARQDNPPKSALTASSISADISAMLLFIIGQSSADAAEVGSQMIWSGLPELENELLITLKLFGRGQVGSIKSRRRPSQDHIVSGEPAERATSMLYYRILRGLRALAFKLQGRRIRGMADPKEVFDQVKRLAISEETELPGLRGRNLSIAFPGPFHLASLLSAASSALEDGSVVGIDPPRGLDAANWQESMRSIATNRPFLWPNHQDAIAQDFLDPGISAVIGYPTGAGKSTITQLKIISTRLAGKKVVFLAPTNALVDQTIFDLDRVISGAKIEGVRDDDLSVANTDESLPDILVMTPETCLMRMHLTPSAFTEVGLLIFDECHLMHPDDIRDRRAIDAMLCLLNFARLSSDADIVLLSAMLKNTNELKDWISDLTGRTALDLSLDWKPTRQLRGCIVYKQSRLDKLNEKLRAERRVPRERNGVPLKGVPIEIKRQAVARPYGFFSVHQTWASKQRKDYAFLRVLPKKVGLDINNNWKLTPNSGELAAEISTAASLSGIKSLVFSQSIPNAFSIAKKAAIALPEINIHLTNEERVLWDQAVDELGSADLLYLNIIDGKLIDQASVHHGQLLREERHLVESLFKRPGALSVLTATPTLGQGMNLPAELVIIAEDSRYNEKRNRREVMEAQDLLNAAGRAGRAGQNATGMVVVIPGMVTGLDDTKNLIGTRWTNLREVFGQSDQCLVLDDPLTALLDRIHDNVDIAGDLEHYLVARLASDDHDTTYDDKKIRKLDISRSFAAFRKRRVGDEAWIASRTKAATLFLGDQTDLSEQAMHVRELASTLGYPEDIIEELRRNH
ncbi:MAG: DEAD/DEAH box helicase, partial [Sulfitobacter sp.]